MARLPPAGANAVSNSTLVFPRERRCFGGVSSWVSLCLVLACLGLPNLLGCRAKTVSSEEAAWQSAERSFVRGDLTTAQQQAVRGYEGTVSADPWHTSFLLEVAKIELWRGEIAEALQLLSQPLPPQTPPRLKMKHGSLLANALAFSDRSQDAEKVLDDAGKGLAGGAISPELELSRGLLKGIAGDLDGAVAHFQSGLGGARQLGDEFQQMYLFMNLGVAEMQREHFEEALEANRNAGMLAGRLGAKLTEYKLTGNAGFLNLKLGDFEHAATDFQAAQVQAIAAGAASDAVLWASNEGLAKFRSGDIGGAETIYQSCWRRSLKLGDTKQAANAELALGLLLLDRDGPTAVQHISAAAKVYGAGGSDLDRLDVHLLEGMYQARHADAQAAMQTLIAVETATKAPPSLRWRAEEEIANLQVRRGDHKAANQWFEKAVKTFQQQRKTVHGKEFGLPFQENGTELYRDYIEHLISQGQTDEALAVLDQSRAEALPPERAHSSANLRQTVLSHDARVFAAKSDGVLLVYYLLPGTSYLWAVSKKETAFYRLPDSGRLAALVLSHEQFVLAARDPLAEGDGAARRLYELLVEPAAAQLGDTRAVYVLADGPLSGLNFETLVVPGDRPHFWIEDKTITSAASLKLLTSTQARDAAPRPNHERKRLLLVGDPVYPQGRNLELPQAAEEVTRVATHFIPAERSVLTQAGATSQAYKREKPGDFTYIHFVAHAISSRSSPLDSAVVLAGGEDKLYAHDILRQPLRADLVTVSGCFSSGTRSYAGEGLVGLAWAFGRAGARHVIGALWEVSDSSTPQMMDRMYGELAAGSSPEQALRDAKLAMIHSAGVFRKPFYWAPFQLYSNGSAGR